MIPISQSELNEAIKNRPVRDRIKVDKPKLPSGFPLWTIAFENSPIEVKQLNQIAIRS